LKQSRQTARLTLKLAHPLAAQSWSSTGGWIYAGDVSEQNGRIMLTNAVWVFGWKSCGFASVLDDPSKADIRPLNYPVDIPSGAEIFRIPVPSGWGLK